MMVRLRHAIVFGALATIGWSGSAGATFSIAACEPQSGVCGVAVATHNLSVGNSVPFVRYGVGAGVSQLETNPCHGPIALAALAEGNGADDALAQALKLDAECTDGMGTEFRQLAIVSAAGGTAAHTGEEAGVYAGALAGARVSVQGNGLASEAVLEAMLQSFEGSKGPLAERLLNALAAGQEAGGQSIGVLSAALRVATEDGWPVDTDIRVDFAQGTAIDELRTIYDAGLARQLLNRAARSPSSESSRSLIEKAARLAPDWDRVQLRAARLSASAGRAEASQAYACRFGALNPVWANLLADEFDFGACDAP
ncbi:MAG: DUF1028 domain-containing protein [Pseudomonadota bacterium]